MAQIPLLRCAQSSRVGGWSSKGSSDLQIFISVMDSFPEPSPLLLSIVAHRLIAWTCPSCLNVKAIGMEHIAEASSRRVRHSHVGTAPRTINMPTPSEWVTTVSSQHENITLSAATSRSGHYAWKLKNGYSRAEAN